MEHDVNNNGILISISVIIFYFIAAILRWLVYKKEKELYYYLIEISTNLFLGCFILAIIIIIISGIIGVDKFNELLK